MLYFIILILGVALLFYVIFGGADYGAGIIELFSGKKNITKITNITYKAIGPVWEANHIWIILIVVILFMGFPKIYTTISTLLHIPILIMLLGIILRGTAFTFRHYDAIKDGSQKYYSMVFAYSSFFTPLFLGIIAGAVISGKLDASADNFYDMFIAGWFNFFSIAVGVFTASLCAYLAAVFLVGESGTDALAKLFVKRTYRSGTAAIIAGGLVFLSAWYEQIPLFTDYWQSPISLASLVLATLVFPVLRRALVQSNIMMQRVIASFQVTMILTGWLMVHFPDIIKLKDGSHLGFFNTQAPQATLNALGIALIAGVLIIIPMLLFLFKVFNKLQKQ